MAGSRRAKRDRFFGRDEKSGGPSGLEARRGIKEGLQVSEGKPAATGSFGSRVRGTARAGLASGGHYPFHGECAESECHAHSVAGQVVKPLDILVRCIAQALAVRKVLANEVVGVTVEATLAGVFGRGEVHGRADGPVHLVLVGAHPAIVVGRDGGNEPADGLQWACRAPSVSLGLVLNLDFAGDGLPTLATP